MTLLNALKTIVFLIITLYIAPFLIDGIKNQYITILEPQTAIGIINITEPLYTAHSSIQQLHSYFQDPTIKGIVLKINCSHTAAGTSQTIFHDIRHLKKEYPKPIIALVENICLSGAYLIASACDSIIAPESAMIGNIGQDFNTWSLQQITSEKNNALETIENESYQQLIKQIALSRKLPLTTTQNWGNGKIFTGSQAMAFGLINEVGSLCTVIKMIKEKVLVEGEINWIEHNATNKVHSISSLAISVQ